MTATITTQTPAEQLAAIKEQARAVANEIRTHGYDVQTSYGHDHGLTEWDVYSPETGDLVGSVWYDGFGVILKGDRIQELAASGALKTWPMGR